MKKSTSRHCHDYRHDCRDYQALLESIADYVIEFQGSRWRETKKYIKTVKYIKKY